MNTAKAVTVSLLHDHAHVESLSELSRFRTEFHACLTHRRDALFEVCEALVCAPGPVHHLAHLSLEPEHRRGHGSAYAALNRGRIDTARLRWSLAALPLPRLHHRLVLAADVSPWLRPDAWTSPERSWCHTYGRGTGQAEMVPGWPYSVIVALEEGSTSWCAPLDILRLAPDQDPTVATAAQLREVVKRLREAGHHTDGDPDVWVVVDAGYDSPRLAFLLDDLPVRVLGRLRSDRVLYGPAEHLPPNATGRPAKHGTPLRMGAPDTWPAPKTVTTTPTRRYGAATARAWDRMHPRLTHRSAWADHPGRLPVIEGTVILLQVEALPSRRAPKPVWLWSSAVGLAPGQVDELWWAYLRRFDIEHAFRFCKQQLGWNAPRVRDPAAADRWTWLVIVAYTQLRLARGLVRQVRLPWQRPAPPYRMSPGRVRRGFRYLHAHLPGCAGVPRPSRPGPGRVPGSSNRRPAPRYGVPKKNKAGATSRSRDKQAA
ncbi:NF041680 family putative transposase [Nocardiopsis sp. FIRDI 009]|uniref:NF041680 family putative transposase n=1 Tax=Nocardiopsis sp. FIRDI 009 TaxID=714197 RepID=UPI001E45FDC8|nr:NF041680 family putative transposase [Nocardiopsis sp. FIRDI 009]